MMEQGLVPTGEQWEDFQFPQHNQILVPSITLVPGWKKIQGLWGSPKTPTELQSFLGSLRIAKGSLQLYPWEFQCQIIPLAAPYPPCSNSTPMPLKALSEFFSAVTTFAVGAAMTLSYFFRSSDVIKNQRRNKVWRSFVS